MSRCYALTEDFKPCRNYAEVLATDIGQDGIKDIYYSSTCKCHRGFFMNWEERLHRRGYRLQWRPYLRNYMKRVLEDGVQEVPKEFIESLSVGEDYTYLIYLCVKYQASFRYSWNPALCDSALYACAWQSMAFGPVKIPNNYYIDFLNCMDNPKEGFFTILGVCLPQQPLFGQHFTMIDTLLQSDAGILVLLDAGFPSSSEIDKLTRLCEREGITKLVDMLVSGEFTDYILFLKKEFYNKCKTRIAGIRDELLEVAWQPARVQEWCMSIEEVERVRKFETAEGFMV